jgi:hypothetical protein
VGRGDQLIETVGYLRSFAQFPFALRRFLRARLTLEQARRIVRERMQQREDNFLRLAERSIYGHRGSPYLALLKLAGCELGDFRAQVRQKGLEGALEALRQAGVYVTFEEFKGQRPIVRHGRTIPTTARDFDNPFARRHFSLTTGGSTGLATSVNQDLDYIAAGAPHQMLMLDAWGVLDMPVVHWMNMLPGGGLRFILQRAYFQRSPEKWFAPVGWRDSKYWIKYRAATVYMVLCMKAMGIKVSLPEIIEPDQALAVARCLRRRLDAGRPCLLYSSVSRALRVSVAAVEAGFDLGGVTMRVGGEPVTAAKVQAMRRAGVRVLPAYGAIDTGAMGLGCPRPAETDDVHFCKDAFALVTHPYPVGDGNSVPALSLTSLLDSSSKVMLNYQSDDYAVVQERRCGCPLESFGFTTHLSGIRSYSKLVGEGVSLIASEMLNILEHALPARYGGTPLDYQLMEQEDESGLTRVYLIIAPRIQIPNEQEVVEFVFNTLTRSSPVGDGARRVWQQDRTLQVKRMEPVLTGRGKLLPLHIQRAGEYPQ